MKRYILIASLCLVAVLGMQAQVLITQSGERIDLSEKKVLKMVFDFNTNYVSDVVFEFESGETQTFDLDELSSMGFTDGYTDVKHVKIDGAAEIHYSVLTQTIHVSNASEHSVIYIYNAQGQLVKKTNGTQISLANLNAGLYIVKYNNVLNTKILKK